MLALYRAGRQAEALEVYRAGRQALVDALAIEPGAELRRLELAILAQDPALDLAPSRRSATVIFADLGVVGLHDDPERGRDELRRAAAAAAAVVAARGGTLQEGIAGAVLALFDGDDHLSRALAAAVSLRDGAGTSARLAVESGEVVAGARDGRRRIRRRCPGRCRGPARARGADPARSSSATRPPTGRTLATSCGRGRKEAACSSAGIGDARYGSAVARDRLVRPRNGRVIAGVCAAIADRFGISRTAVRIAFVLSIVLPGPQVVVYLLLWILIPSER